MWRSGATGPRWYRYKGIKRQVRIDANGRLVAESSVPDDPALISPPESKPGTAHGKPALIDRQNPVLASGPICPRRPPKNGGSLLLSDLASMPEAAALKLNDCDE